MKTIIENVLKEKHIDPIPQKIWVVEQLLAKKEVKRLELRNKLMELFGCASIKIADSHLTSLNRAGITIEVKKKNVLYCSLCDDIKWSYAKNYVEKKAENLKEKVVKIVDDIESGETKRQISKKLSTFFLNLGQSLDPTEKDDSEESDEHKQS